MRALASFVAALCLLALPSVVAAQVSQEPKKLWSEYPLVQRVETQPSAIGATAPAPPVAQQPVPVSDDGSARLALWLGMLAGVVLLAAYATRSLIPLALPGLRSAGIGARPRRRRTRRPARTARGVEPDRIRGARPVPTRRRAAQYAPPAAIGEQEPEPDLPRSVLRRTGLLRSRFVVVTSDPEGPVRVAASSPSFWSVGPSSLCERAADDAWNDLVVELRRSGWEPDLQSPSAYFVPYVKLRRMEDAAVSILPTIEAYTHAGDAAGR
jgi:hypothetical protein